MRGKRLRVTRRFFPLTRTSLAKSDLSPMGRGEARIACDPARSREGEKKRAENRRHCAAAMVRDCAAVRPTTPGLYMSSITAPGMT